MAGEARVVEVSTTSAFSCLLNMGFCGFESILSDGCSY